MKRKVTVPIVIVALIALDQWVKFEIVKNIQLGGVKPFIPKILSLTYLRNTGAAFSILENQQWLFAVITLVVIGAAIWYLSKHIKGSVWLLSSLSLIIAGGIGNFIDRMRQGFVVDMFQLDFINFAIFNVADSYLTIGVMVLVVMMLKEEDNASKDRN
ncbi:signal peptidase II [Streptococcus constellatus subsp. pharyngis]|uniref:Lipoprotein signal peptidase n=1 Tax=Streptococcus constellatus subsp. pharyngis SK1060 = CCUG 46377 TaxID=1035184 RepID=F9P6K7_STRCV|nr:signal peptidase II [Streptococcus constellatus]AGU72832.1 putative signal peptidase II [Streptococcus constellatus subsp. pharyngis C232]AGU74587.1 putative signal peptidase II [Streptococcus constellatus subsp. pharyngis C818]AGU79992.1 putative signal peptidase II [Streptococcus constellatus subsp. pharyngis C1050]EGV09540.1 signal peptidase II [Streptococcus constellatus subsp. pharyngis SK1060 = CCUG 46377]QRP82246.1 signal peptidase II [Streptococcus constellatus]